MNKDTTKNCIEKFKEQRKSNPRVEEQNSHQLIVNVPHTITKQRTGH